MKKEEFAYVGCRLLALFYGVKALFDMSSFVTVLISWKASMVAYPETPTGIIYVQLISLCLNILFACLLWFGAGRIVQFLLSEADLFTESSSLTVHQVQTVAFATVGVFILGLTVPEVGRTLFRIIEAKKFDNSSPISMDLTVQIFFLGLRMLIGLFLVFGSKGLSGLLTRLRAPELQ